jgi:hypothetical protein
LEEDNRRRCVLLVLEATGRDTAVSTALDGLRLQHLQQEQQQKAVHTKAKRKKQKKRKRQRI